MTKTYRQTYSEACAAATEMAKKFKRVYFVTKQRSRYYKNRAFQYYVAPSFTDDRKVVFMVR